MDNEFDLSQDEIRAAMDDLHNGTRVHAISKMDDNPEDASRALELGQVTGIEPAAIHDDLEGFDKRFKASTISTILDANPQIGEYIRSHPLAASVSNDDYGNLDLIGKTVPNHEFFNALLGWPAGAIKQGEKIFKTLSNSQESGVDLVLGAIPDAILGGAQGLYEGLTEPPEPGHYDANGKWVEADWQALDRLNRDYPAAIAAPMKYMYGVKDFSKRIMHGVMGGIFGAPVGFAKSVAQGLGLSDTEVEQIGRDIESGLTDYMSRNEAPESIRRLDANIQRWKNIDATIQVMDDVTAAAKPWVDAGLTPPRGVHPAIDKYYADTNSAVVEQLMKNLDAVQNASTLERSQELMKGFLDQYYENSTIGISPQGILNLYGGKAPEVNDGILGWVPDLAEQLDNAALYDHDVHIPIKDWLTNVDPAVMRALKDDIRTHYGLITKNELAEGVQAAPSVDSPIAKVRAASGLEPLFGPMGDRKLTLRSLKAPGEGLAPGESGLLRQPGGDAYFGDEVFHEFKFYDESEKAVGDLTILPDPENKTLWVANINGLAGLYSNSFGPSLIRDLKKQLKTFYPEYEWVQGHRVSGAREAAGTQYNDAVSMPKVRLGPTGWDFAETETELTNFRKIFEDKFRDNFAGENTPNDYAIVTTPEGDAMFVGTRWNPESGKVEAALEPLGQARPLMEVFKEKYAEVSPAPDTPLGAAANAMALVADRLGLSDLRTYRSTHADSYFKDNGGLYNPFDPAILVRGHSPKYELQTLVHETAHAALHEAIRTNPKIHADILLLREYVINAVTPEEMKDINVSYGLTDAHEFPTLLASIELPKEWFEKRGITFDGTIKTVWDWFLNTVREAFGMKDPESRTVLDAVMKYGEQLEAKAKEGKGGKGKLAFGPNDNVVPFKKKRLTTIEEIKGYTSPKIEEAKAKVEDLRSKAKQHADAYITEYAKAQEEFQRTQTNDNPSFYGDEWIDHISERGRNALRANVRLKNEAAEAEAYYKAEQIAQGLPNGWKADVKFSRDPAGSDKYRQFAGETKQAKIDILNEKGENVGRIDPLSDLEYYNDSWFSDMLRSGAGETIDEVLGKHPDGGGGLMFGPKESIDAQIENLQAATHGLDVKTMKNLIKTLRTRHAEDVAAATARAEKIQRKTQTKEWKEMTKALRVEVEKKIKFRPDVLADMLIGAGELAGAPSDKMFHPLRASELTDEQKAALPRRYYSNDGLMPDAVANLVGFPSGDAMVEALIEYNKDRSALSSREHLKKVIDAETERQMVQKHGELDANIMRDAVDQAMSENDLNLLQQEWLGAAMTHGIPVDPTMVRKVALEQFNKLKVGNIDSRKVDSQMLKHYNYAFRELTNGNPAKAILHMQRRYELGIISKEARALEKAKASVDKTAKWARKRDLPTMTFEWTDQLHDVLNRTGYKLNRTPEDIKKEINAAGYKGLEHFAETKAAQLIPIEVWEDLFDQSFTKHVDEMTPEEFYAFKDTVDSLVDNGRMEQKVYVAGDLLKWHDVRDQMVKALERFKEIEYDAQGNKVTGGRARRVADTFVASHINMENTLNRWDGYDPMGIWQQTVMRGLHEGAGDARKMQKEVAEILLKKVKTLSKRELRKKIDNPLFKLHGSTAPLAFTRKNLLMVMLNTGTKSNLMKMAKGYDLDPDAILAWVNKHATKAEWDFVQGIWDDVFGYMKKKHDTSMRSMGVRPAKDIPRQAIQTKFGEYAGGYFPVIPHPEFPQRSATLIGKDPLIEENFFSAVPQPGFTKDRTGWAGPIALDLDSMPNKIGQVIHDTAMRPALINAHKVFKDPVIQDAVFRHYGPEYRDELIPYIRGLTNSANYTEKASSIMGRVLDYFRTNLVSSLIMGNLSTVLKHTPTALGTSLKEVSPVDFARGVRALFTVNEETGERNWDFMMRMSNEMPLRDRSWGETIYGASHDLIPGGLTSRMGPMRARIIQLGTKPVALGDLMSAAPTWMGRYLKEIDNGRSVGDAVYLADRAVRRAHGSMSSPNRTPFQRNLSGWWTSIYNFWSDIMNRQMETLWRAGEAAGAIKKGEWKEAMKHSGAVISGTLAYVLWPALIEHMVTGGGDEEDSWTKEAGLSLMHTLAGGWIGVRDLASALFYNRDPQFGLAGTGFNMGRRIVDDILRKDDPWATENRNKLIQHGSGLFGLAFGMASEPIGRGLGFLYDVKTGEQSKPMGPWQWAVGYRYGKTEGHSESMKDYWRSITKQ